MSITQQQSELYFLANRIETNGFYEGDLKKAASIIRQYIEQSTAQPQRPTYCGTGHCSCIECVVEPTAQAERAPVVQAAQAGELVEQEMAMLIRRLCSTTANDKTRAQAMEYLFKRGHASPLRAESEAAQAMEHPPLPEGVKARFKCEDCGGTGYTGDMIPGSEFQPPEPVGCTSCNFTGWWAECEAYSADQMHAYLDADRASSGATPADVRMLTEVEFDAKTCPEAFLQERLREVVLGVEQKPVRLLTPEEEKQVYDAYSQSAEPLAVLIQRAAFRVNAGKRIPADGVIGGAA